MILKTKKAFTLAECLVCLLLISILATILLPAIMQNRPNKNKVMFRKAYYITERIVSELINDEDVYPTDEQNNLSGFSNQAAYTLGTETFQGPSKFCNMFFQKVNTTTSAARCDGGAEIPSGVPVSDETEGSFMTNDGVIWYMPATQNFKPNPIEVTPAVDEVRDAEGNIITPATPAVMDGAVSQDIIVDVNGIMAPNCFWEEPSGTNTEPTCPNPDRFRISIRYDGKIQVEDPIAKRYLMSNTTLR